MSGRFIIDRNIFDSDIWQYPIKFRIFFTILGRAVWSKEGVKVGSVKVNRGQYLRSYRKLQDDTEYIENNAVKRYGLTTIKRTIDTLVDEDRLKKEVTELGTLFTVVNYEQYQQFSNINKCNLEQQRNSEGTAEEQQRNNNKKVKKVKKDNNREVHIFFEEVWKSYPSKKGKNRISETTKKEIYSLGSEFKRTIGRYIKEVEQERKRGFESLRYQNGSTFFNGGYIDYLDDNYEEMKETEDKGQNPYAGWEVF